MKNEPSAIEALNWRNDLDIIKINLENLTETCGLNAQEIAILLARVSRVKDFIKQALKKAEAYDRVVVPLMEARRKATEGEWYKVGLPWNNASPYIISGHHDPHVGEAIIDVIEKDCFTETDNMTCEELEHEYECQQHANCDFITLAANLISQELKGGE